jgi:DNA-binding GntR family transcriptional regulator
LETDSESAPQQVADAIRDALVRGEFAPGQRLVESDVGARYGVGRAVVREALRLLASDGLVTIEPRRAARVRLVSLPEAIEIAEVRVAVESMVAGRAAERVTPEQAEELRSIGSRMREAVQAFDPLGYSELNELLHVRISEIAGHEAAAAIIERLRLQLVRFNMRLSLQPGRPLATLIDHEKVIDAIARGDSEGAAAAMGEHLHEVVVSLRATETTF